jgi:hypothetical protein
VVEAYKHVYEAHGKAFPQDANEQLQAAIDAVFGSWNNERAIKYRLRDTSLCDRYCSWDVDERGVLCIGVVIGQRQGYCSSER